MLKPDYLSLRLGRLRGTEEWHHDRPGVAFVFPRAGSGRYNAGASGGSLQPGDILAIDGAPAGRIRVAEGDELIFWWFAATCEHLYPLFDSSEIHLVQGILEEFKRGKVYPESSATAQEGHRLLADVSPQFNLDHRSQLLRVVAVILGTEFNHAHLRRSGFVRAEEHMTQVFEELSVSEIMNFSVAELAKRFGCSRRHLNRLFHIHFGTSVAHLRMELRLSKAVSLLRDPDAKIIRVAEECGFNHLGLFNTCFKRRFGFSPGQWRKNSVPVPPPPVRLGGGASDCAMRASGLCPWTSGGNVHPSALRRLPQALVIFAGCLELLQVVAS